MVDWNAWNSWYRSLDKLNGSRVLGLWGHLRQHLGLWDIWSWIPQAFYHRQGLYDQYIVNSTSFWSSCFNIVAYWRLKWILVKSYPFVSKESFRHTSKVQQILKTTFYFQTSTFSPPGFFLSSHLSEMDGLLLWPAATPILLLQTIGIH